MRFGGRYGAHITTRNDKSGPTSYAATGGHRCHRLSLSPLRLPPQFGPSEPSPRESFAITLPAITVAACHCDLGLARTGISRFRGETEKQFPFGAGETSSPARNRNRLLIVAPPRRALPKLVLGIPIDYTTGGFLFWFGLVLSLFPWSIACLVSVFVRFWVKFWGAVLLSLFEAVRGGFGWGREVVWV